MEKPNGNSRPVPQNSRIAIPPHTSPAPARHFGPHCIANIWCHSKPVTQKAPTSINACNMKDCADENLCTHGCGKMVLDGSEARGQGSQDVCGRGWEKIGGMW